MQVQIIAILILINTEFNKLTSGKTTFNLGINTIIKNTLMQINNLLYFILYILSHLSHFIIKLFTDFNLDKKLNVALQL